ncbi:hypothetical protein PEC18_30330 [Paucibacter sp. O1-1]|nr:hypothetical protein [Paucibacter sp. O1-1]MDA3830013.1 hypothetical protein [Paucibacter sp. O1-1]
MPSESALLTLGQLATLNINKASLKYGKATYNAQTCSQAPGTVISATKQGIEVATADGSLIIETMQLPNKKQP